MEKYYKNGMYRIEEDGFYIYEIPRYGGKPQLEGFRLTEEEAKKLIDTFT